MALEIYIARHGQNVDNANGILNGHRDLPLTGLGRNQAKDLARGILDVGLVFDRVFSSPLSRALETAQIICRKLALADPVILDSLIERDFGIMTGKPHDKIIEMCAPDIIVAEKITYFLHPDGAETFPELVERGRKILSQIRKIEDDGKVLLVCHGDLGKMIYAAATGSPWEKVLTGFHFGNAELIDISDKDTAHVITLSQHNK